VHLKDDALAFEIVPAAKKPPRAKKAKVAKALPPPTVDA
jgi:hypothetical protein